MISSVMVMFVGKDKPWRFGKNILHQPTVSNPGCTFAAQDHGDLREHLPRPESFWQVFRWQAFIQHDESVVDKDLPKTIWIHLVDDVSIFIIFMMIVLFSSLIFVGSVESVDAFSEVPNPLSPAFLSSSKQSRQEASPEQIHGMAIQPSLKNCHRGHPLKEMRLTNAKLLLEKFCHSLTWKEQLERAKVSAI